MNPEHEELFRRLALNDERAAGATLGANLATTAMSGPDNKTNALNRVAALIAAESALASYQWAVDAAMAAGASDDDIVDVLTAVAPIVGLARTTAAAPALALALGYDVTGTE
jgi:alkylhydroperoxidase/carboxymuconolactone decarboxylase family protein YurZ